jgi:hypothetical protein
VVHSACKVELSRLDLRALHQKLIRFGKIIFSFIVPDTKYAELKDTS